MMFGMEKAGRVRPVRRSNRRNDRRPQDCWGFGHGLLRERIAEDGIRFELNWELANEELKKELGD